MADTKVSALTAVATPAGTDEIPVNQAGTSKKLTLAQVKTFPFPAGSASANSWPKLTAGTLLTTPEAGALELDSTNLYGTTDAGNRGYIPIRHFIRASAAQTLTSSTAAQNIFDSPANGRITLQTGIYLFEMMVVITGLSATSGNAQIRFAGTGTFGDWLWHLQGLDTTASTTIADDDSAYHVTNATAASAVAAAVNTVMRFKANGTFECSAAGTLIPQIDLVTASAGTVAAGSYFLLERMGASGSVNSLGQWS